MPRRPPVNPQPATPPIIFDGPRRSKTPLTQVSALQGNAAEFEAAEIVPRVSADDSLDPAACAPEAERFMGTNPNASGLTAAMSASSAALRLGSPAVGEGEALISPTRATILRHEFNWKKIEAMRERAAAKAAEFEEDDAAGENAPELTPPSRDFKALTQFYHATSGAMEWKTRDGWEDEVSNDAASASADDNASVFNVAPGVIATFVGVTACARDPSRVMRLSLPAHALQGKLPSGLGRLDALVELELHSNPRLRGAIPAALGDCAALQLLSLHSNRLTGAIPSELGRCRRLRIVRLQLNRLSGPLPPSLCALPRLRQLQCQSNQLTGPVPEVRRPPHRAPTAPISLSHRAPRAAPRRAGNWRRGVAASLPPRLEPPQRELAGLAREAPRAAAARALHERADGTGAGRARRRDRPAGHSLRLQSVRGRHPRGRARAARRAPETLPQREPPRQSAHAGRRTRAATPEVRGVRLRSALGWAG